MRFSYLFECLSQDTIFNASLVYGSTHTGKGDKIASLMVYNRIIDDLFSAKNSLDDSLIVLI